MGPFFADEFVNPAPSPSAFVSLFFHSNLMKMKKNETSIKKKPLILSCEYNFFLVESSL